MVEKYEELAMDAVTLRPILYPHKLFGRFYDVSTLDRLLDAPTPRCPFSRTDFTVADIEKPNLFERDFFDVANNGRRVSEAERTDARRAYVSFCRRYGWDLEAAELGDEESMVPAALFLMSSNRLVEARKWASKAAVRGIIFGSDVLGHICMLEKNYLGAHEHFVKCWADPKWNTKDRTAYFIAECYFERELHKHASRWAFRAADLGVGSEAVTLCAQIAYLNGKFNKCILLAERAKKRNMLAAFLYALCQLRQLGKFKGDQEALCKGSKLMHCLNALGYIEAGRFLANLFAFDTVRNARRDVFRM